MSDVVRRSFFSEKLGEYVFCHLEPISKEEWDAIQDEPGKLKAVEYEDGYYRVVDYFTEKDCVYMTVEEIEKAGNPDAIVIDEADERKMEETGKWRVRAAEISLVHS